MAVTDTGIMELEHFIAGNPCITSQYTLVLYHDRWRLLTNFNLEVGRGAWAVKGPEQHILIGYSTTKNPCVNSFLYYQYFEFNLINFTIVLEKKICILEFKFHPYVDILD